MKHWSLWLALVVILILLFINELLTLKKKAKELSPQLAVNAINNDGAVVVDIRDKEAFKAGHIIDSIHANADDFAGTKMSKYKNKPIILVCANGQQSPALAAKVGPQGFQVQVLAGGITAWQTADLPLVKGKG